MVKLLSMRETYGATLLELAKEGRDIVALAADTADSMYTGILKDNFPERTWDVGIAEQNMMDIAAGLASTGKVVFASTYCVFSSMRTCEQIRTFIAYPGLNVKIVSGLAGLSAGIEGVTHMAVEDVGIMRSIPNLLIVSPADAVSTKWAIRAAADYHGPVYVRLGRDPSPVVFDEDCDFQLGKGRILKDFGKDLSIITTGFTVPAALMAGEILRQEKIGVRVIEIHTIKPLDEDLILAQARDTGKIMTVEEHSIIGGLGSAVAELLSEKLPGPVRRFGLPDCFLETGTPGELREHYGLTANSIAKKAMEFLRR